MAKRNNFTSWIIQEDADYIFINKPGGISSLKERGNSNADDILSLARTYNPDVTLCHRLDKFTSGIMLLAKNEIAMRNASMQFQKREVHKKYHALVQGAAQYSDTIIELPIDIDEKRRTVRINKNLGKKSKTQFNTIEVFKGFAIVECILFTGRMHQIRIHTSVSGYPIIGDTLYGGKELLLSSIKYKYNYNRSGEEQPIIKRFALHSFEMGIKSVKGEDLIVTAPYAKDFMVLLSALRKNCS